MTEMMKRYEAEKGKQSAKVERAGRFTIVKKEEAV